MSTSHRNVRRLLGLVGVVAVTAFATGACLKIVENPDCCKTYSIPCSDEQGNFWSCQQTMLGSGFTIQMIAPAPLGASGQREQGPNGTFRGECTLIRRTCGNYKNAPCLQQPPIINVCQDSTVTGENCVGGQ